MMIVHKQKVQMSKVSTVLMTAGPRSISPWGDRNWRVALSAQLVEGGSSAYWLASPTQPAQHPTAPNALIVEAPQHDEVVDSILMLLATHLGDGNVEGYLLDTHNVTLVDGVRVVAPFWDITAAESLRFLVTSLSGTVRLAFTILDDNRLVDETVIETLRVFGFDVEVYRLDASSTVSAA